MNEVKKDYTDQLEKIVKFIIDVNRKLLYLARIEIGVVNV